MLHREQQAIRHGTRINKRKKNRSGTAQGLVNRSRRTTWIGTSVGRDRLLHANGSKEVIRIGTRIARRRNIDTDRNECHEEASNRRRTIRHGTRIEQKNPARHEDWLTKKRDPERHEDRERRREKKDLEWDKDQIK